MSINKVAGILIFTGIIGIAVISIQNIAAWLIAFLFFIIGGVILFYKVFNNNAERFDNWIHGETSDNETSFTVEGQWDREGNRI